MTDPLKPPIVTPIDAAADAIDDDDESHLPAHEERAEPTEGGGTMSQGGTAADPGTGGREDDDSLEQPDNPDAVGRGRD